MKHHLYLDLDRTLFDTEKSKQLSFAAVEQHFGVSGAQLIGDRDALYAQLDAFTAYDLFTQLEAYGIDAAFAEPTLRKALAAEDFLYPDARELLAHLAKQHIPATILSFGTQRFQHFKYSLVPELQALPLVVTLYKDAYLAAQTGAAVLVDDRVVTPLPPHCRQLLIDRAAGQQLSKESPQLWRINSLKMVETLGSVEYNEPKGTKTP